MTVPCCRCSRPTPLHEVQEYGRCEDCWVLTFVAMEDDRHLTEGEKDARRLTKGGSMLSMGGIRVWSMKAMKKTIGEDRYGR